MCINVYSILYIKHTILQIACDNNGRVYIGFCAVPTNFATQRRFTVKETQR